MPTDFLIVTALPKERDACLERLQGRRESSVAGYTVYVGTIGRLTVTVALADRMGNTNAATVTTALISALRPRNVLLVGIAAGLRKQSKDPAAADSRSLGDVLVADQIVDYESAKIGASGVEPRPFWHPAAAQLIRAARELRPDDWTVDLRIQRPPHGPDRQASRALFGTVLSGNKVVADAAFANEVRRICPAAVGLEMEGFGVASACHQASPPVSFLLIKAICDFADEHKSDDWQPYAADAAAAFAAALIKRMAAMPGLSDLASPQIAGDGRNPFPATDAAAGLAGKGTSTAVDDSRRSVGLSEEKPTWLPVDEMLASSLVKETGPPTDVRTPATVEPPRLPAPHISRSTTFSALAYELSSDGTVAVIGYSKSGKTSLLVEFARGYPSSCVWLNVECPPTSGDEWRDLAVLQLAGHFELSDATPAAIGEHLLDEVKRQPIIVVIDDAHLLPNLDGIRFLDQAVAASDGRLKVILAGVDEPGFVDRMRSRAIPTWRVPGFTLDECCALLQDSIGDLTAPQRAAVAALRDQTDGHPGIVRLCRDRIRQINTEQDAIAFVASLEGGLGTGPDAFHAALFGTFQAGLSAEELELCRRLAIALHGFSRRLAERLWEGRDVPQQFADAWDGCLRRAFDPIGATRHQLPTLYRDGLLKRSTPVEKRHWHEIAGEVLSKPIDGGIDVVDAGDSVEHAVLAGRTQAAVHQASQFLLIAGGRFRRAASRLLVARFEQLFEFCNIEQSVDWATQIRWHVARATAYRNTNQEDQAREAGELLYSALTADGNDPQSPAGLLGWATLIIHAATFGQVKWALAAARHLKDSVLDGSRIADAGMLRSAVISAYLASDADPTDGLRFALQDRDGGPLRLWVERVGFDLWRGIGFRMYEFLEQRQTLEGAKSSCTVLQEVADVATACGEIDLAIMALAVCSRVQIDYVKDFAAALTTTRKIELLGEPRDTRTAAFGFHALGNAYRCAGKPAPGAEAYRLALGRWQLSNISERAETVGMLAVCEARIDSYKDAFRHANQAAELFLSTGSSSGRLSAVHCHFESANSALLGLAPTKALRPLLRAHALLEKDHRDSPEWVVLAQMAMQLSCRLESRATEIAPVPPGFTIGLRSNEVETTMDPSAPTLLLGRACYDAGSPHRALELLDNAAKQVNRPMALVGVSIFGMEAALAVRDIVRATELCATLFHAYDADPDLTATPYRTSVANFQLSRVVSLAAEMATTGENQKAVATAAGSTATIEGAFGAAATLRDSLTGLRHWFEHAEDTGLNTAFSTAVRSGALNVARELAWFWCFRHAAGRPLPIGAFLKWQWRLVWTSMATGAQDPSFLAAFRNQLQEWWTRLANSTDRESFARSVRDALTRDGDAWQVLSAGRALLGHMLATEAGIGSLCECASEALLALDDLEWLAPTRERVTQGMAELLLSPLAGERLATLSADLGRLEEAVRNPEREHDAERQKWTSDITGLRLLFAFVDSHVPQPNTTTTLLKLAAVVPHFTLDASAANYYVWLRHTLQSEPMTTTRFDEVQKVLASEHAARLAGSTAIPTYLRHRLAVVHYGVVAGLATKALVAAVALLRTQQGMGRLVAGGARASAHKQLSEAIASATAAISDLEGVVAEIRVSPGSKSDLASGLRELGGQRMMVGKILQHLGDTADWRGWLRSALRDFSECVDLAPSLAGTDGEVLCLQAAFEGQLIAEVLHDGAQLARLSAIVGASRRSPVLAKELASLEELHASDGRSSESDWLPLQDEEAVKKMVEMTMRAAGLPEDRRRHVEDDARKVIRSEEVKRTFCQHLQPLQNLEHTFAPNTIYARPTKYTCECRLLHYRTAIETEDIDVAIDAMKRTYCEGCDQRSPLLTDPDSNGQE